MFTTILLGLFAGIGATLVMDLAMRRLPEGETPPTVAAGVLTDTHPDSAPGRVASAVHYGAGMGTGVLFLTLLTVVGLLSGIDPTGSSVFGVALFVFTSVLLFGLMVGFFVLVVLPRPAGFARQRLRQISRDWAISAAVYVAALSGLVVLLL
ncbi:MAG: hypothetical protein PPP58_01975 [Natronomonas sp.]